MFEGCPQKFQSNQVVNLKKKKKKDSIFKLSFEQEHEVSNNVLCATSKAPDQPAHTRSLIGAFACRLTILWVLSYWLNTIWSF